MSSKMTASKVLSMPRGVVMGAGALADPEARLGEYRYQWLHPGPNARPVFEQGTVALPDISGGGPLTAAVVTYQVPFGYRFSLRGVVFAFIGSGWSEGSGDLVFSLVVQAAGTRPIDFLGNVVTQLGSLVHGPYPISSRLEFAPGDVVVLNVTNNAVANLPPQFLTGHLVGHIYPNSEQ